MTITGKSRYRAIIVLAYSSGKRIISRAPIVSPDFSSALNRNLCTVATSE